MQIVAELREVLPEGLPSLLARGGRRTDELRVAADIAAVLLAVVVSQEAAAQLAPDIVVDLVGDAVFRPLEPLERTGRAVGPDVEEVELAGGQFVDHLAPVLGEQERPHGPDDSAEVEIAGPEVERLADMDDAEPAVGVRRRAVELETAQRCRLKPVVQIAPSDRLDGTRRKSRILVGTYGMDSGMRDTADRRCRHRLSPIRRWRLYGHNSITATAPRPGSALGFYEYRDHPPG